ncbi:uncharacterized protein LOC111642622 [Centruroides sculpturatus]|uniref:uncharacterized protein LOC111642622 n=1 Tax=Centruroides sculpturatus TaxID=218467 RepID=UPI000C6ED7BE|nr:uncharacterized protein LOC111642622 [Centruroides sculpturatus]
MNSSIFAAMFGILDLQGVFEYVCYVVTCFLYLLFLLNMMVIARRADEKERQNPARNINFKAEKRSWKHKSATFKAELEGKNKIHAFVIQRWHLRCVYRERIMERVCSVIIQKWFRTTVNFNNLYNYCIMKKTNRMFFKGNVCCLTSTSRIENNGNRSKYMRRKNQMYDVNNDKSKNLFRNRNMECNEDSELMMPIICSKHDSKDYPVYTTIPFDIFINRYLVEITNIQFWYRKMSLFEHLHQLKDIKVHLFKTDMTLFKTLSRIINYLIELKKRNSKFQTVEGINILYCYLVEKYIIMGICKVKRWYLRHLFKKSIPSFSKLQNNLLTIEKWYTSQVFLYLIAKKEASRQIEMWYKFKFIRMPNQTPIKIYANRSYKLNTIFVQCIRISIMIISMKQFPIVERRDYKIRKYFKFLIECKAVCILQKWTKINNARNFIYDYILKITEQRINRICKWYRELSGRRIVITNVLTIQSWCRMIIRRHETVKTLQLMISQNRDDCTYEIDKDFRELNSYLLELKKSLIGLYEFQSSFPSFMNYCEDFKQTKNEDFSQFQCSFIQMKKFLLLLCKSPENNKNPFQILDHSVKNINNVKSI